MEVATDPYELKLYQMFQSCDTKHCGFLDEEALRRLCGLLELRDKGSKLIAGLDTEGVSFDNFKEALLNFLGTELDGSATSTVTPTYTKKSQEQGGTIIGDGVVRERTLVIRDDVETYFDSPPESSDREVSPKFVVGSKKYGRRSRPQSHAIEEFSLTDSDNCIDGTAGDDGDEEGHSSSSAVAHTVNHQVQRSSSQTDIGVSRRRRPLTLNGNKLKRCSSLPAQRNPHNLSKSNKNKNNSTAPPKIVPASQDAKQLGSSVESLDTPSLVETLPAHSIIDIWERANINNGRGILLALGFDDNEVNLVQLNKVLEEELRVLEDDSQMSLVRASLALQSAELLTLRQSYRQMHDENAKLRADNKDTNRRAAMLAVEIDERHASLEINNKNEIRTLEQRHAGVMRDLTARMANDRENWTNLTSRLEMRIKHFEQEEVKFKTELELTRKENNDLEAEQQKMQKQITELLEKNIELNREIAELEESTRGSEHRRSGGAAEEKSTSEDDEVLRLVEKVSTLQMENTDLRDKNDELVAEVENLNLELTRVKSKSKKCTPAEEEESELGTAATATKRRGDSPSKARITEESPRLGKLRKCTNEPGGSENSDTSGEWMPLNSELQHSEKAVNTSEESTENATSLKQKIAQLEKQLQASRGSPDSNNADDRCKELEASLEQMQKAYEDCEDYWQSKLSEERQLYEKERQIYEEEQQESDKKFTELMEKVREYEEQFSKDGRLSPIEEKDALEQQYVDLEAEAEEIRENARRIFEEKSKEIESLQSEIEDLRLRLGESVEILTGACELNEAATSHRVASNAAQSPASSPISYLWHQSTIQEPVKNYASLEQTPLSLVSSLSSSSPSKQNRINLSTSETAIFSTTPVETVPSTSAHSSQTVSPIQKPNSVTKSVQQSEGGGDVADCDTSSTASGKSFETRSITSQTQNPTKTTSSQDNSCTSPSGIKEELKRLKYFELSLKEQVKDLSLQRDGLVMELQQLHEARPVLEKAYARTAHPTLIQRVNQLELKNRHLQNVIKQQQQYTESLMQQSWRQHQIELSELHNRIEAQSVMISDQLQRLQNADIMVKDLYVENSHLTATVQRLEQQRTRVNLLHQQQRQGLNGLPGMP